MGTGVLYYNHRGKMVFYLKVPPYQPSSNNNYYHLCFSKKTTLFIHSLVIDLFIYQIFKWMLPMFQALWGMIFSEIG